VLKSIADGNFQVGQLAEATYRIAGPETEPQQEAIFLVTARELTVKQERVGTLYIGKDVTFQHDLFRWLLVLLIGMSLLFFVLARWFSQLMSRRAIVPIAKAYARQREFVADASHELRTPMSVLLRSIEALQLQDSIERDPFAQNVLSGMEAEVHSITKMAGDLLHLARSDAGEIMVERTLFNVRTTAEAVLTKLQPLAQAKGLTLALQAPDELTADGDEEKVMQLLVLLVENAIKYTPASGAVQVRLRETGGNGGRVLVLEVQDTGIGIAPEVLPRIFDRFYREDKSRTRQVGGHGLGLAIAKHLVDACQGTIQVESEVGAGSTFKVRLPM
jgi:signal transduction histidine kinase